MLIVYASLGVASIILNTLFIGMLWRKTKVSLTHKHYLCSLGVSNLLISLLCLNWDIRMDKQPTTTPQWVCVLQFYGAQIGLFSSMGVVVVMSIDKCVAIREPVLYKTYCTLRTTRVSLVFIHTASVVLSLLPTGDFVDNLSPVCTVVDLYPRKYGVVVIATVILFYLVAQITVLSVLVVSLVKFILHRNTEEHPNRNRLVKAQRATRIILCSLVLYTITTLPLAGFSYWIGRRDVDLVYILTHDFSAMANCMLIVINYIDPSIYFLCVVIRPLRRRVHPSSTESS